MALRGTLKDFGIADILQLVGHQGKNGVLALRNGGQKVDIVFTDGCVVRAESATRDRRDLLGRMLVRAEVLSEEQVERALELQKRTQKRLGQILVESGGIDRKVLATFTRLQTIETIYRLFFWSNGSYEFAHKDVPADPEFVPLKCETILIEGFRQLDEWPSIRRKVTSYGVVFERVKELDPLVPAAPISGDELDLDGAFGDGSGDSRGDGRLRNIGQNERLVFQLISAERDVQKLVDLSRLGEFDTCKALERLIEAGFIRPLPQERARSPSSEATVGGISARSRTRLLPALLRVGAGGAVAVGLVAIVYLLEPRWLERTRPRQAWGYVDQSVQAELGASQMQKIERALATFEAMTGGYPPSLAELVAARLLTERDLHFPWQQPYGYHRDGAKYRLQRPLF